MTTEQQFEILNQNLQNLSEVITRNNEKFTADIAQIQNVLILMAQQMDTIHRLMLVPTAELSKQEISNKFQHDILQRKPKKATNRQQFES